MPILRGDQKNLQGKKEKTTLTNNIKIVFVNLLCGHAMIQLRIGLYKGNAQLMGFLYQCEH